MWPHPCNFVSLRCDSGTYGHSDDNFNLAWEDSYCGGKQEELQWMVSIHAAVQRLQEGGTSVPSLSQGKTMGASQWFICILSSPRLSLVALLSIFSCNYLCTSKCRGYTPGLWIVFRIIIIWASQKTCMALCSRNNHHSPRNLLSRRKRMIEPIRRKSHHRLLHHHADGAIKFLLAQVVSNEFTVE